MNRIPELDWLKKWAHYSPAQVALKDADSGLELTYRDFFETSNRLARALQARFGITRGDRIALIANNELESIVLFFAAQRLGAVLVPINFRLTPREVSHILQDSTPRLLIHQTEFDGLVRELSPVPEVLKFEGAAGLTALMADSSISAFPVPFEANEEEACMILYTSGTTGSPKGALITPKMLFWNSVNTTLRLNLTQSDVNLSFLPLFHTGGWNVLTTPLIHRGAKVVLLKKFDAERILQLAESEKATILFGVPTMMDRMAQAASFATVNLSQVRYAIVGGEPMPVELIQTWEKRGIPVRQGYGLTEFGPNVFSLNEEDSIRKIGSIGFPNFYVEARIVDESGHELGAEEIGELALRGPAATPGYWKNPSATAETLRDGWLHTGDLVRRDSEGYYYVVGRKKDMFISGGENVYPAEIEQFLRTHPAVHEAAVIGVSDPKWGESGKAFIALHPEARLDEQELAAFCSKGLARFKIPKQFRFLPALPKGDTGKILKRSLADL